jgi:hypothetical protein
MFCILTLAGSGSAAMPATFGKTNPPQETIPEPFRKRGFASSQSDGCFDSFVILNCQSVQTQTVGLFSNSPGLPPTMRIFTITVLLGLPLIHAGGFIDTCDPNWAIAGDSRRMSVLCKTEHGDQQASILDLNRCLANVNGEIQAKDWFVLPILHWCRAERRTL